ncbi:hypothetical protein [Streptomyces sp. NRRL S-87]|uniref:hypothetical protein n=1 Tax=Streptomyces sp. NRRL S-87 TaxID=1463920 RepID=UPI00068EC6CD|nr:hypothetical protein [Streptomyces sp. NRRL S-87]
MIVLLVIGLPVLTVAMAGAVFVRVGVSVRHRSLRPLMRAVACFQLALAGLGIAALAFGWGHMTGFSVPDPYAQCNGLAPDRETPERHLVTRSVFPVSVVCSDTPDGRNGDEQVPGWVNPTVFTAGGVGTAALVATPFTVLLRRRRPDPRPRQGARTG